MWGLYVKGVLGVVSLAFAGVLMSEEFGLESAFGLVYEDMIVFLSL